MQCEEIRLERAICWEIVKKVSVFLVRYIVELNFIYFFIFRF